MEAGLQDTPLTVWVLAMTNLHEYNTGIMEECVCHQSSINKNEPLMTLSNIEVWNTLLNVAPIN